MNQKEKLIIKLLLKFLEDSCSEKEIQELKNWIDENQSNKDFIDQIFDPNKLQNDLDLMNSFNGLESWNNHRKKKNNIRNIIKWFVAASITISGLTIVINRNIDINKDPQIVVSDSLTIDSKNRENLGAQLTFPSGKSIHLINPLLVKPSGELSSKNTILSNSNNDNVNHPTEWMEINVPKEQNYSLQLPDSTKVWLNSNTTIRFPTKFDQTERIVEINGEAYFDVKHNPTIPFKVKTKQAEIKVLGTSFNLNNYNSRLIATLAEGKIDILTSSGTYHLKPLHKAEVSENQIQIYETDLLKEIAWKSNKFYFKNDKLSEILFQIENWYGIKTNYQSYKNNRETFSGTINRNLTPSEFLEILSKTTNYNYQISNNTLLITIKQ